MTFEQLDRRVRLLDPVDNDQLRRAWHAADAAVAVRDELLDWPRRRGESTPRRRRVALVLVAVALVALTGWTSYRLLRADPTGGFGCRQPDGSVAVIDLQSGDHAADCAAQWTHRGVDPPPLTAYERPTVDGAVVEVVPASEAVPDTWTPLNGVDSDDMVLIELESQMDDYVDGLRATCRDGADAARFARGELQRLGLPGWQVTTEARGQNDCATATVDVKNATVSIRPDNDGQPDTNTYSWMAYAVALRDAVADDCLDLTTAKATARDLAARIDAQRTTSSYADAPLAEGLLVTSVVDDERSCTAVDLNVYGMANLKLRGPK